MLFRSPFRLRIFCMLCPLHTVRAKIVDTSILKQ